jgi:hypothetical protein
MAGASVVLPAPATSSRVHVDRHDRRRGEGGAVRRDLLAVPGVCAVLVPVEPQPVSGGPHRDDGVAVGDRDRRPGEGRGGRAADPPGATAAPAVMARPVVAATASNLALDLTVITGRPDPAAVTVPPLLPALLESPR